MIELFSRLPDGILFPEDREIVPIPVDEDLSSLSAILMDEDYYSLLINERRVVNNIPVISPAGLICLKMHAWLDLTKRKLNGEPVDFEDIRKHKNDVFRLFFAVAADDAIVIPLSIQKDVRDFLTAIEAEPWEIKNLGKTIGINMPPAAETIFQALYKTFGLQLQKY